MFSFAAELPNSDRSVDVLCRYPSQATSPSAPAACDGCMHGQSEEGTGLAWHSSASHLPLPPGGHCTVRCCDKLPAPGREERPERISCRMTVSLGMEMRGSAPCPSYSAGVVSEEVLKKDVSLPAGLLSVCTNTSRDAQL